MPAGVQTLVWQDSNLSLQKSKLAGVQTWVWQHGVQTWVWQSEWHTGPCYWPIIWQVFGVSILRAIKDDLENKGIRVFVPNYLAVDETDWVVFELAMRIKDFCLEYLFNF